MSNIIDIGLRRALTFAVLMQGNGGIETKSPKYVMEKWETVKEYEEPEAILDSVNRFIITNWMIKWKRGLS